ncbi:MAG: hypothetical protein JO038_02065 [Alphaproteobacteria bacterium]|nr:hypothetical protein [Alphaproteobacteria bacterium]
MDADQPRPVATSPDADYSLSIDDAVALYERAGLPRTPRSVQRYCARGHLDCRLVEVSFGEQYRITPASVAKHIAYVEELRQSMTGRDVSRLVATGREADANSTLGHERPSTGRDETRQGAAETEFVSRYVARLERENEFLRGQIGVKDGQIKELTERARETNVLIAGLQKMLTPLLGRPAAPDPNSHEFRTFEDDRGAPEHNA